MKRSVFLRIETAVIVLVLGCGYAQSAASGQDPAAPSLQMSLVYPADGVLNPGSPESIQAEITVDPAPTIPIHKYRVAVGLRDSSGRVVRNRSYRPSAPQFLATIAMKNVPPGDYSVNADLYNQKTIVAQRGPFIISKRSRRATPIPTPTRTASPSPTPSSTPSPTATPTVSATATSSPTATITATQTATATATATCSVAK